MKSLIFQCLPILADALFKRPCGSSVIVVISLLRSLMEDQVHHLNDTGVTEIAITNNRSSQQLCAGLIFTLFLHIHDAVSTYVFVFDRSQ